MFYLLVNDILFGIYSSLEEANESKKEWEKWDCICQIKRS